VTGWKPKGGELPPNCRAAVALLRDLPQQARIAGMFRGDEAILTRAPGRLDLMGGIADYSGALVLPFPLERATVCVVQGRSDRALCLYSQSPDAERFARFQLETILPHLDDPASARRFFAGSHTEHWCANVLGILAVWKEGLEFDTPSGLDILIRSDVPEGAGISSSAALQVATASAIAAALGVERDPVALALDCQRVENLVVGAACGPMDQLIANCGEENHLLRLLCQPAEVQGHLPIPAELAVWGIDSGCKHSVAGDAYESVRVGAFMGHRILMEAAGVPVEIVDGVAQIENDPWGGYLANISVAQFETHFDGVLPVRMEGLAFLERYGGTIDPSTRVQPTRQYSVRAAATHPVYAQSRVSTFSMLLEQGMDPGLLGRLMTEAHTSYNLCGLGSPETDRIVALAEAAPSVHGARITGGGSGGTVAILADRDAAEAVQEIAARYAEETGNEAQVFSGSSPGAASFGVRRLVRG
jgi:L-arabinokinase